MQQFLSQNIWLDYLIRILAAFVAGFLLGIERKLKNHTVGVRTLVLISISSAMLSIASIAMSNMGVIPGAGDPTRIAAGVITGIGFLGAGAIINQGLNIRGLTSAAIIFTAAALGVTCGAGLYLPALAVLLLAVFTLFAISKLEHKLFPAERRKALSITFSTQQINQDELRNIITGFGLIIHDLDIKQNLIEQTTTLTYTVKTPDNLDSIVLMQKITQIPGITKTNFSKYL